MKNFSMILILSIACSLSLAGHEPKYGCGNEPIPEPKHGCGNELIPEPKHGCGNEPRPEPKHEPKRGCGHEPKNDCKDGNQEKCPPCNPLAGCRIWRCPCTHEGFTMYPGNYPLNPPRPSTCPPCVSDCPNLAIRCFYPYLPCDAEQVCNYKCIEKIEPEVEAIP